MKLKVKTQVQDDQVRVTAKAVMTYKQLSQQFVALIYRLTYNLLTTAKEKHPLCRGCFSLACKSLSLRAIG